MPTVSISYFYLAFVAISGGVMAFPSRANAWVSPCAKPRLVAGVQYCIARVAVGKVAPSPKPSATRAMNSVTSPVTKPVMMVEAAQIKPHHAPPLEDDPAVVKRVEALAAPGKPLYRVI